jgi:ATP/maltotriose-dependent transcriptional regulator MalT
MDRLVFNRGVGAQGADAVRQILAVPAAKRAPLTRGAQTLLGFFHLCEYNYESAERVLAEALGGADSPDESGIPAFWTRLLAGQVALLRGDAKQARALFAAILAKEDLPPAVRALATEHLAEALRLDGDAKGAKALIEQVGAHYKLLGDAGGQARMLVREAVWLVYEGQLKQASAVLSEASALAETAGDPFALNTVVRAMHLLAPLQ